MDEEISNYIGTLNEDEKKELLLNLRELNRSMSYGLENDIKIYLHNLYIEYIKTKTLQETQTKILKNSIKRYKIILSGITLLSAIVICVF